MKNEYQIITIIATSEQNEALAEAFSSCGFSVNYTADKTGYAFDLGSMSTIIVAIVGAGGLGAIIKSVVDAFKTNFELKLDADGNISEIKIKSRMQPEELLRFITEIKNRFGKESASNEMTQGETKELSGTSQG